MPKCKNSSKCTPVLASVPLIHAVLAQKRHDAREGVQQVPAGQASPDVQCGLGTAVLPKYYRSRVFGGDDKVLLISNKGRKKQSAVRL